MDPDLRARAEARLAAAAGALGLADPRPPYRERLRELRQDQRDAFDRAIEHYEQRVLPALIETEPLPAWVEYGRFLASLTTRGEVVRIDAHGRAAPWTPEAPAALVLFIPQDTAVGVMVLCQPLEPSDAQRATVKLLVERKLS
jgi:hypothetical protein